MTARFIMTLTAATLVASPAAAQMFDGFLSTPGIGMLDTMRRNETFWAPLAKQEDQVSAGSPHKARSPEANPAALGYIPDLKVRQHNLAGFVKRTRVQSPENADQMARLFASTDIFAAFEQGLAPTGLRIDNVADAYAVYWIAAWEAAHGITGSQTSRAQAQGVKAQVSRALLSTPDFTVASASQKQELAEALLVQAALISASAEAAANASQRASFGKAVRQGAKAMGLDLDAMVLSEAGFVSAGR